MNINILSRIKRYKSTDPNNARRLFDLGGLSNKEILAFIERSKPRRQRQFNKNWEQYS